MPSNIFQNDILLQIYAKLRKKRCYCTFYREIFHPILIFLKITREIPEISVSVQES